MMATPTVPTIGTVDIPVLNSSAREEINPDLVTAPCAKIEEHAFSKGVGWDGSDDPENPMNWSEKKKRLTISLIAFNTFLASMAPTIFAPGVPLLMKEFKSSNEELAAFVVSVYIIGFGSGPLFLAPLSELYGRAIILHIANVAFVVFSVACGVSSDLGMFIAFRLLSGIAGCVPVTIGGGVIADIVPIEKRGAAMSVWGIGPILGPVIGPVIGGYVAQAKGWRWIFWLLTIVSGVVTIASFAALRETYGPILLQRKARRLQVHGEESGDQNNRGVSTAKPAKSATRLFLTAIVRPTKMLLFSPIVSILALLISIYYSYLYFLFTSFTPVFQGQYSFSTGESGLAYIGTGVGLVLGLITAGMLSDKQMKRRAMNGSMEPENRLPPVIVGSILFPTGLLWYGWSAKYKVHWIVPQIGTSFVGFGGTLAFLPVQMYLVDAFQAHAASAVATNTILRNIIGATLPLAGGRLYDTLGLGWGNSLLASICFAVIPVPVLLLKYGKKIRMSKRFKLDL